MTFTKSQKEKALNLSKKLSSDFDEGEAEEFAHKHMDKPWYEISSYCLR